MYSLIIVISVILNSCNSPEDNKINAVSELAFYNPFELKTIYFISGCSILDGIKNIPFLIIL